jgi:hypothetical protein
MMCLAGLSCAPAAEPVLPSDPGPGTFASQAQALAVVDATFDPVLLAPVCDTLGSRCDSTTLLTGRGLVGPETNAPNTLGGSCADGQEGTFHSDASVDAIRVLDRDGIALTEGRWTKVEVDVWGAPSGGSSLMLFRAANAQAPNWVHVTTMPTTGGAQTLSTEFRISTGGLQAVRAVLVDASQAANVPCTPGATHDHDDLAFTVTPDDTTQPVIHSVSPKVGTVVSGTVELGVDASDDREISRAEFYIDDVLVGSDTSAPYGVSWDSASVPNGQVMYMARVFDWRGNFQAWAVNLRPLNEQTPPVVSIPVPMEGARLNRVTDVIASASDDIGVTKVEFYVDDTLFGSATAATFRAALDVNVLSPGPHTLTARAYDASGKMTVSAPVNIFRDMPPTAVVVSPTEGAVLTGTVTLTASVTDDLGVTRVDFRVGESSIVCDARSAPYSCSWQTRGKPNGPTRLRAEAYDAVGNKTLSEWVNVTLDNDLTPPIAVITTPTEGATLTGTVVFSADVTDNVGVTRVDFLAGDRLAGTDRTPPFSINWNTINVANGVHALKVRAWDAAGNQTASALVNVTVDNERVPPTVVFTSPTEGATLTGGVTLSVEASDDQSGVARVEFYAGAALMATDTTAPYTSWFSSRNYPNGPFVLTAKAYDGLGNVGSTQVNVTLDNDLTAPTVAFTSPTSGATLSGAVTLSANASDDRSSISKVEFYLGNTLLGTDWSAPYTYSWNTRAHANGAHVLTAKAQDAFGNMASSTALNVTVDNDFTVPTVAFTAPSAGATLSGTVELAATASDNVGVTRVEFYDGASLLGTDTTAPYSLAWNTAGVAVGGHTLTARAYDAVGNVGTSASVSVTVSNDTTAPTVSLTFPAPNATLTIRETYTLTATASDNVGVTRVEFFLDGGMLLGSDSTAPYSLSWYNNTTVGVHTLSAKAYDAAGNVTTSTAVTVSAQNPPPVNSLPYSASNTNSASMNTVNHTIALTAGQVLTLGTCGVTGSSFSGDTYLRLYNPSGAQVASNDDACGGAGSNLTYTVPSGAGGNYQLRAGCYSSNSCSGTVVWTITSGTTPPPPPPSSGNTLTYTASNTGSAAMNTVNQTIPLLAGQTITLGTCGVTGSSFSGDTFLRLYNPSGTQVHYSDDACGGAGSNITYLVPSGSGGNYQLRAGCYSSGSCGGTVAWTIQ